MKPITAETIEELARVNRGPCVSLYMPTIKSGPELDQNRIRFENLYGKTERNLQARGVPKAEIQSLLRPLRELPAAGNSGPVMQPRASGLAVFRTPDFFSYVMLPARVDEVVVVGDHFHLKPLFRFRQEQRSIYLLVLAQHTVKLYELQGQDVREVDVPGLPADINEALPVDDPEKHLQYHTHYAEAGGRQGQEAVFHGQGSDPDEKNNSVYRFVNRVENAVSKFLTGNDGPLVLATVDYLAAIYEGENEYKGLVEQAITGNPEHRSLNELRDQAQAIVRPLLKKERHEMIARYEEALGKRQASAELPEIITAAQRSRVSDLLISSDQVKWGRLKGGADGMEGLEILDEDAAQAEDLLNIAAVKTVQNGGRVLTMPLEEMPSGSLAGAVFRY